MTLSKQDRNTACCNMLNAYLFDHVWNEPFSEYRINIQPQLIKPTSKVGSFSVVDGNIPLPTEEDSYYIWAISSEDFNVGLNLPSLTWFSLADVCNSYNTLIHMYGINGAIFHHGTTFIMYNGSRNFIYIAAKKHMVQKTIPFPPTQDVFLTVYYDSDRVNPVRICSVYTTKMSELNDLQLQVDTFLAQLKKEDQLSVYVDGVDVTDINHLPMVDNLTYYDFIIDENILFSFEIDLVSKNQDPVFLSERDKTWKQIIHIPRELNPDNKIITHNTCDFTVYRKYGKRHGYYLHRASYNRTVSQVTHNDMAIPLFILDAYRDYLQTQEIKIKGVVRIHEKDNILIRDANYIDLLYSEYHSDDRIVEILASKGPEQIPWWKASHLEQSRYVDMMFDTPNLVSDENITDYVKALGFYQVVNILCKRIMDITISDAYTGSLTYNLPVLYTGMQVIPILYLNGKPVQRQYYDYTCNTVDNTITIVVSKQLYTKIGDKLTIVLFVDGDSKTISFTPTESNLSVDVPFDDAIIYLKKINPNPIKGVNIVTQESYIKCLPGSNIFIKQQTEEGSKFIFNGEYVGSEFLIQSAYCSYLQSHNLKQYTETGATLAIPASTNIFGYKDKFSPIFEYRNVSAFLNGNYLIRNVDYFINEVRDKEDNFAFSEVVIQTMDYFNEDGDDVLDILFNVAEIEDLSWGFSIRNRLQDETPVNLYFPNVSVVHVDGSLVRDLEYRGIYILLHNQPELNGGKFEIQTSVPKLVRDFILEHATNEDYERIKILNEYFYPFITVDVDFLVLEDKHRMYSAWMNTFIHDALTGKFGLALDPDDNRMEQQLQQYDFLKQQDLIFKGLDQRFIDFYPQYVNYEVTPEMKLIIDRLISRFMPKNIDPTEEVVYG